MSGRALLNFIARLWASGDGDPTIASQMYHRAKIINIIADAASTCHAIETPNIQTSRIIGIASDYFGERET